MKLRVSRHPAAFQGWTGPLRIWTDGRKFSEPWECLTCFYSRVGKPMHATSCMSCHRKFQLPYILNAHKASRMPRYYITKHDSAHAGPFSRLWEYCYQIHSQGYGNTAYWAQWRSLTHSVSLTCLLWTNRKMQSTMAGWLSWLDCPPKVPGLWILSPVRAYTGINKWVRGWVEQWVYVSISLSFPLSLFLKIKKKNRKIQSSMYNCFK